MAGKPAQNVEELGSDRLTSLYSAVADDGKKSGKQREAAVLFSVAEEQLDTDRPDEALESAKQALAQFKKAGDRDAAADTMRLLLKAQLAKAAIMKWHDQDSQEAKDMIKKSEKMAKEELNQAKQAKCARTQAAMQLSVAEINYDKRGKEKRDEALQSALAAVQLCKDVPKGDAKLEGMCNLALARIHYKKIDAPATIAAAKAAITAYQAAGDKRGEAEAWHTIGSANNQSFKLTEAIEMSEKAAALFKECGAKQMYARECHVMATQHLKRSDVVKALASAKECHAIMKELRYGKGWETAALSIMSECLINMQKVHLALRECRHAIKDFTARGDQKEQVRAMQIMTSALAADNDHSEAERVVDEGIGIAQSMGDKYLEIEMRKCGVQLALSQQKFDEALSHAETVKELYKDLGATKEEAITLMHSVAKVHCLANDKQKTMDAADDALKVVESMGDKSLEAYALLANSAAFVMNDEANKALKSAQEAVELFNEVGEKKGEAQALMQVAQVQRATEQYKAALSSASEALDIQEALGDRSAQAKTILQIADIQIQNNRYKDAISLLMDGVKLAKSCDDGLVLCKCLVKVASSYAGMLEHEDANSRAVKETIDKALKSGKEAAKMAANAHDMQLEASAQFWLASLYLTAGKFSDVMQAAQEAISLYKQIGSTSGQIKSMCLIGKAFLSNGKSGKAKAILDDALDLAKKVGDDAGQKEAGDLLKEIETAKSANVVMMAPGAMPMAAGPAAAAAPAAAAGGAPAAPAAGAVKAYVPPSVEVIKSRVTAIVGDVTGEGEAPDHDTPFMDAGVDSLSSVELRTSLQKNFGVQLPSTVMFNFPTTNAISAFLLDELVENEISIA